MVNLQINLKNLYYEVTYLFIICRQLRSQDLVMMDRAKDKTKVYNNL